MTQGWYLARIRPMCEYSAAVALERTGYKLYFPRLMTYRPRAGHDDAPLFPGYLFIHMTQEDSRLPSIRHVAGLVGWVEFDGVMPAVPDEAIEELRSRVESINGEGGYWKRFRPGEMVRIIWGSAESFAEVVEDSTSPQSQVRVLLDFMGQLVPARVPWQDLEPVGDQTVQFYRDRLPRRTRGKGRWIRGFGPRRLADVSASGG